MLHHLLQPLFDFIHKCFESVQNNGSSGALVCYLAVVGLMALESSVFPLPSEIVIPPAAYLATKGVVNIYGIVLAGTIGSWIGSALSYLVARWLGRVIIARWGRLFFISEEKLERAEHWLHRYEAGGIFFARLLPGIRHLISIPAGIIRMDFKIFSAMTIAGAAIWCAVLAWFGKTVIDDKMMASPEDMMSAIKAKSHLIVFAVLALCALYFVVMKLTAKPEKK